MVCSWLDSSSSRVCIFTGFLKVPYDKKKKKKKTELFLSFGPLDILQTNWLIEKIIVRLNSD